MQRLCVSWICCRLCLLWPQTDLKSDRNSNDILWSCNPHLWIKCAKNVLGCHCETCSFCNHLHSLLQDPLFCLLWPIRTSRTITSCPCSFCYCLRLCGDVLGRLGLQTFPTFWPYFDRYVVWLLWINMGGCRRQRSILMDKSSLQPWMCWCYQSSL